MSTKLLRRHVLAAVGAGFGLLAAPSIARAQSGWPDRPIRLMVPFGAGGAIDTLSRTVASKFAEVTGGQTLVVENRPGAGGTICGAAVARERPDGLTLMMADVGANAIGKELIPSLPYDPPTAFTPIIHLVNLPAVLMAHPSVTATTIQQVIDQAKARPDGFTYSSAGNGNGSHLFMALFLKEAGIRMVHVPYRSGAEMVTSLMRGDAQFGFPTVSSGIGQIRAGNARAIAVGNAAGTPLLPDAPAISTVLPGFEVAVWHGIVAPAGMDAGLAREINQVFGRIAAMPDIKQRIFDAQAGTVVGGTPADFAGHIAREVARWTPIIREGGIATG
ncbi:tripartite tricarboxylate transporter substrate binding protein [Falsiroseomonas sp.]|uniref:Bug family tripartite tricarboxylate transporter substrate binding protein n=1 Tax=Falsiroseomonas sp. TaxID=2870721 RepID=UPI002735685E|nr:tripartite tricarboxylate transporter substrate-binding protein [Falsiroseomonas sp.]MDP3419057.1 tripartite tricarboxylate transporter substrate-binding protein [Falsiroseomonas sp.]